MDATAPVTETPAADVQAHGTPPTLADVVQLLAALASMVTALCVLPLKDRRGLADDAAGVSEVAQQWAAAMRPPDTE